MPEDQKKHKHHHKKKHHKKHRSGKESDSDVVSDVDLNQSLWVEKTTPLGIIPDAIQLAVDDVNVSGPSSAAAHAPARPEPELVLERPSWMVQPPKDLFSSSRVSGPTAPPPDAATSKEGPVDLAKVAIEKASKREAAAGPASSVKKYTIGDGGAHWRLMKLKRVYETAERENRSLTEVALERYGSLEAFEEAKRERDGNRDDSYSERRSDSRGSSSSSLFRKPGEGVSRRGSEISAAASRRPSADSQKRRTEEQERFDKERESKLYQPLPSNYKDNDDRPAPDVHSRDSERFTTDASSSAAMTQDDLNKLQAKVLRAKLTRAPNLQQLEQEFESAKRQLEQGSSVQKAAVSGVAVLPSFNAEGKHYDIGSSSPVSKMTDDRHSSGRRRKRRSDEKDDEAEVKLNDLMRQERMAGASFDEQLARRIATDAAFNDDLEYLDEHAGKLAKKKQRTEEQKRTFAIHDYKRSNAALEKCWYCFDEGRTPSVPFVAVGVQVYLALPKTLPLVPGHCLIVPMQHQTTTLDCDEGAWDEIRNFMKCLIQMNHAQNKGVIFMETCTFLKKQRHAFIECIPVPPGPFDEAPGCFRQAILEAGEEWSQHRKIIDTRERGFRRSLVPNLPYFHVWFDHNGGYGHVIENEESFPSAFGRETVGGLLDLSPDWWRKPRFKTAAESEEDVRLFKKQFAPFDWTKQLQ